MGHPDQTNLVVGNPSLCRSPHLFLPERSGIGMPSTQIRRIWDFSLLAHGDPSSWSQLQCLFDWTGLEVLLPVG